MKRGLFILAVGLVTAYLSGVLLSFGTAVPAPAGVSGYTRKHQTPIFTVEECHTAGKREVRFWRMQLSGADFMIPTSDYDANAVDITVLPPHLRPADLDDMWISHVYAESGWPFASVSWSMHWLGNSPKATTYSADGGFIRTDAPNGMPRAVPWRPLWLGLLGNALIHSSLIWLVLHELKRFAAWRRSKRGHCRGCGYNLSGLGDAPCPECGRAVRDDEHADT